MILAGPCLAVEPPPAIYPAAQLQAECTARSLSYDLKFCLGYLSGHLDAFRVVDVWKQRLPENVRICRPGTVTIGQLQQVVLKYFADHPENLHVEAGVMVFGAMVNAWPCR